MDGIVLKLVTPIEVFKKVYSEIGLKEPSGSLFLRLGEPRVAVASGEGGGFYFVERADTINVYLDRLLEIEGNDAAVKSAVLSQLSFADAVRLKRTLFSFFDDAAAKAAEASSPSKQ